MKTPAIDTAQIENIEFDGIDYKDWPKFCDAYIASATYKGREMTEEEIEQLEKEDPSFFGQALYDYIF